MNRKPSIVFLSTFLVLALVSGCNQSNKNSNHSGLPIHIQLPMSDASVRKQAVVLHHRANGEILGRFNLDINQTSEDIEIPNLPNTYVTFLHHVQRESSWPKEGTYDYLVAETYPIKVFSDEERTVTFSAWGWIWLSPDHSVPNGFERLKIAGKCPENAAVLSANSLWWPPSRWGLVDLQCEEDGSLQSDDVYPFAQDDGKVSVILEALTTNDEGWYSPLQPYTYVALWDRDPDTTVVIEDSDYQSDTISRKLSVVNLPSDLENAYLSYEVSGIRKGVPTFGFQLDTLPCDDQVGEACSEAILANATDHFESYRLYGELWFWTGEASISTLSWKKRFTLEDEETWNYVSDFSKPFEDVDYDYTTHTLQATGGAKLKTMYYHYYSRKTLDEPYSKQWWQVHLYEPKAFVLPNLPADLSNFYPDPNAETASISARALSFDYLRYNPPPEEGRMIHIYRQLKLTPVESLGARRAHNWPDFELMTREY